MTEPPRTLVLATVAGLSIAFTFGIGTLWVREQWALATFQIIVFSLASAWFAVSAIQTTPCWNPPLLLPFAVAAIGVAQIVGARTDLVWATRQAAIEWFTHGCVGVLVFQLCRASKTRVAALRVFALAAGLLALISTIQHYAAPGRVFFLFDSGESAPVFGPFLYHTKLAVFAKLALPVACWLALTGRPRFPYAAAAVSLIGAVLASASRGGLAVISAEILILAILAKRRGLLAGVRVGQAVLICGLILGVGVTFGWELMWQRVTSLDPLRDLRLPILASSVEMAQRYWVFGSGLATWPTVYPEFARFDVHLRINQAHCDWMQWLIEGGVAQVACMLLILYTAIRASSKQWWPIGTAFVLLHGAFDYPMQQTPVLTSLIIAVWSAGMRMGVRHADGAWADRNHPSVDVPPIYGSSVWKILTRSLGSHLRT